MRLFSPCVCAPDSAVTGGGSNDADTDGGEALIISGQEFGPEGESALYVIYGDLTDDDDGSSGDLYRAAECAVTYEYTQITCYPEFYTQIT